MAVLIQTDLLSHTWSHSHLFWLRDACHLIAANIAAHFSLETRQLEDCPACCVGLSHSMNACWMLSRILVCLPCLQGRSQRAGEAGEDAGQGQGQGGEGTEAGEPAL